MRYCHLLHHLPHDSAERAPEAPALTYGHESLSYAGLSQRIGAFAGGLLDLGIARQERVAIYLEKRFETVIASFGAAAAGAVFVPLNPLLKVDQVAHILRDCNARILVTSPERFALLHDALSACHDLRAVVLTDSADTMAGARSIATVPWNSLQSHGGSKGHRVIDQDMVSILYTSGSTGRPKGVVLSHRNMVTGARSVASYLENRADDTLLAALPLSFDAGFSQLTTAFHVGARVVLLNYLLPRDVLKAVVREKVTGLTAVPPLWIQLSRLEWPESVRQHLRYIANTGGHMPLATLESLRAALPTTRPYLMYGLTEAFRSCYLPPEELDRRPDSIGKAIPDAEILVLREDGTPSAPNEPGELVHRGALVSMGYWNDPEKTAERFRPLPNGVGGREPGMVLPELAVFSGDTVRMDEEGFLYFIGRRDDMIKTSGYRVSPTEIEEVLYGGHHLAEVAAVGVPHPVLGQAIVVIGYGQTNGQELEDAILSACRANLPAYMIPARVVVRTTPLPRNPNGKIDRKSLATEFAGLFQE